MAVRTGDSQLRSVHLLRDTRAEGQNRARILIIGYGTPDRGDDSLGLIVADSLRDRVPTGVEICTSTGDSTQLIETWAGSDKAIVVDVFESGGMPGTIYRLEDRAASDFAAKAHTSTHGFGLREAIRLGRELGRMPRRLVVIGVEAGALGFSEEMTPEVRDSMDEVRRMVLEDCQTPE